jgi:hypothetical protein
LKHGVGSLIGFDGEPHAIPRQRVFQRNTNQPVDVMVRSSHLFGRLGGSAIRLMRPILRVWSPALQNRIPYGQNIQTHWKQRDAMMLLSMKNAQGDAVIGKVTERKRAERGM